MVDNQYKVIEDFPDYSINARGDIYSSHSHRLLKHQTMSRGGYKVVSLYNSSTRKKESKLIHRLVAMYFVPNPDDLPAVSFKDDDVTNVDSSNLHWCTQAEVISTQHTMGLRNPKNRNIQGRKSKTVIQRNKYGEIINRFPSIRDASRATGMSTGAIQRCAKGIVKKPRRYSWSFDE